MTKKTTGLAAEIKRDLLDQLERADVRGGQYVSLVNDYMALWQIKEMLLADIEKRGVLVESMTGNGFVVTKKNDSVDQVTRISTQMLKVLSEIGIKPGMLGRDEEEL